mgnify:CR=1 FL=1
MKLKVCGMKYIENIQQVAELKPDYLGFIFYEKSKRNFDGIIPELPKTIKKVGVFVNATIDEVVCRVNQYDLQVIQLHGDETVAYINELKCKFESSRELEIIKVFGIKDKFNFDILNPYLDVVDYFLFDTKGKERGGNGITFDWKVLGNYPYSKPFFLSGGIGLKNKDKVMSFLRRHESKYCYALDVNSKFEIKPGVKKIEELQEFKKNVIISKVK